MADEYTRHLLIDWGFDTYVPFFTEQGIGKEELFKLTFDSLNGIFKKEPLLTFLIKFCNYKKNLCIDSESRNQKNQRINNWVKSAAINTQRQDITSVVTDSSIVDAEEHTLESIKLQFTFAQNRAKLRNNPQQDSPPCLLHLSGYIFHLSKWFELFQEICIYETIGEVVKVSKNYGNIEPSFCNEMKIILKDTVQVESELIVIYAPTETQTLPEITVGMKLKCIGKMIQKFKMRAIKIKVLPPESDSTFYILVRECSTRANTKMKMRNDSTL